MLDEDLTHRIHATPLWREQEDLLRSVPGIGPGELPELGRLTHEQIAALVSLAPLNRDSGSLRGRCIIWDGRAVVRGVLYMSAVVAARHNHIIKAFYQRLRTVGKALKAALVACMRKLLTMLNARSSIEPLGVCQRRALDNQDGC